MGHGRVGVRGWGGGVGGWSWGMESGRLGSRGWSREGGGLESGIEVGRLELEGWSRLGSVSGIEGLGSGGLSGCTV